MRKTAIFKDDLFLQHDPGHSHVESPSRLAVIYDGINHPETQKKFIFPSFDPAPGKILELIHTPAHVARVAATAGKAFDSLDPDTQTSARSFEAASLAAGALVKAVEMLAADEIDNAFALVRPPGHHAEADAAMGFCLFNNIAIAAQYALKRLKMDRVLIVDWDLHHGNGTQHAFYDNEQALYFSTHQYPYYPGTGSVVETGSGPGAGFTVNVPLPGGLDDRAFAGIYNEILSPVARQFRPEIIMVSAGYDIYQGDPLGAMGVTPAGFAYMTRVLVRLADELCGGRLLVTLEGGYNLAGLRDGVLTTLAEMAGTGPLPGMTQTGAGVMGRLEKTNAPLIVMEQVRNVGKKYWSI